MEKYSELVRRTPEIIDFFIYFSRFEYALKRNDCSKERQNGSVKAEWKKFSEKYKDDILSPIVEESLSFFEQNSPRKKSGKEDTEWIDLELQNISDHQKVIIYIQTVRNNLFHGDKFDVITSLESQDKDIKLIRHSLNALKEWAKLKDFKDYF